MCEEDDGAVEAEEDYCFEGEFPAIKISGMTFSGVFSRFT